MENELFKRICARVAIEEDPEIIELLKTRMRLLLSKEIAEPDAEELRPN
jgi:hypothetical protein